MTGDVVNIETLNIGNAFFGTDAIPGTIPADMIESLREEIARGGIAAIMHEDGVSVSPEVAEPDDTPTPKEQAELDQARAEAYVMEQAKVDVVSRADYLRNVVHHVTRARKLEGFETQHERAPRKRSAVERKHAEELRLANISLQRACARCIFQNNCKLAGNIQVWTDAHPYIDDKTGKRRPGSSDVQEVESRKEFLKAQDKGVAAEQQVHCDPAKRK